VKKYIKEGDSLCTMASTNNHVRVLIATPYLTENLLQNGYCEECVQVQRENFGYDPDHLIGAGTIIRTQRHVVEIETKEKNSGRAPHLMVIGCTRGAEEAVTSLKGSGILCARYSIFYGGPSDYTGNYPDEAGYALDIPKDPSVVHALLRYDEFLESIIAREEERIRTAVDHFNEANTGAQPILITDYLREALKQ
jgi:hypothetical protein